MVQKDLRPDRAILLYASLAANKTYNYEHCYCDPGTLILRSKWVPSLAVIWDLHHFFLTEKKLRARP